VQDLLQDHETFKRTRRCSRRYSGSSLRFSNLADYGDNMGSAQSYENKVGTLSHTRCLSLLSSPTRQMADFKHRNDPSAKFVLVIYELRFLSYSSSDTLANPSISRFLLFDFLVPLTVTSTSPWECVEAILCAQASDSSSLLRSSYQHLIPEPSDHLCRFRLFALTPKTSFLPSRDHDLKRSLYRQAIRSSHLALHPSAHGCKFHFMVALLI
jgi:hypothetical protein